MKVLAKRININSETQVAFDVFLLNSRLGTYIFSPEESNWTSSLDCDDMSLFDSIEDKLKSCISKSDITPDEQLNAEFTFEM